MSDIKAYRPESRSISQGQVLKCPYDHEKAALIVREMADILSLELVEKGLAADQIVLTIGYDRENMRNYEISSSYRGEIKTDHYGRAVPVHAHGTANLGRYTSSSRALTKAAAELMERISDKSLLVRRINITANHVIRDCDAVYENGCEQLDLFSDFSEQKERREKEEAAEMREKRMQQAILKMKQKYGKNAVLRGMNFCDGATTVSRNGEIGGHRA